MRLIRFNDELDGVIERRQHTIESLKPLADGFAEEAEYAPENCDELDLPEPIACYVDGVELGLKLGDQLVKSGGGEVYVATLADDDGNDVHFFFVGDLNDILKKLMVRKFPLLNSKFPEES